MKKIKKRLFKTDASSGLMLPNKDIRDIFREEAEDLCLGDLLELGTFTNQKIELFYYNDDIVLDNFDYDEYAQLFITLSTEIANEIHYRLLTTQI